MSSWVIVDTTVEESAAQVLHCWGPFSTWSDAKRYLKEAGDDTDESTFIVELEDPE